MRVLRENSYKKVKIASNVTFTFRFSVSSDHDDDDDDDDDGDDDDKLYVSVKSSSCPVLFMYNKKGRFYRPLRLPVQDLSYEISF